MAQGKGFGFTLTCARAMRVYYFESGLEGVAYNVKQNTHLY
jgi:hypothetical protein